MLNYLAKPTRLKSNAKYKLNAKKVNRLTARVLSELGLKKFDLSLSFVSATAIRKLNRTYRHKDKSTDVLSFPASSYLPKHLGDVIVSLDDARKNSRRIGQTLDREVAFLITHGVLHLCGYDHHSKNESRKMFAMQKQLMEKLEWKNCITLNQEGKLHG